MNKQVIIIASCFLFSCMSAGKHEQGMYDEVSLKAFVLNNHTVDLKASNAKLDSILTNASNDSIVFLKTISYFEKPFGDPGSSYRNDHLYTELLLAKLNSPWYDSIAKTQAKAKLYLAVQNRIGSTANDFTYTTPAWYKKKMHGIKADHILLLFYNPECDACRQMKEAIMSSPVINNKISNKQLAVLAIYTDKDEKIWLDHISEMPGTWLQGRDEDEYLYKNKVYDLRAIPSLYLLDKNKKVLLKDGTDVTAIEKILK